MPRATALPDPALGWRVPSIPPTLGWHERARLGMLPRVPTPPPTLIGPILRWVGDREGRVQTPVPGLWFFRASAPFGPKRVDARMVTLALILQGAKHVDFGERRLQYRPGEYLFVTGERRYTALVEDASEARPYLSLVLELAPESLAAALVALGDAGERRPAVLHTEPLPEAFVAETSPPLLDAITRLVDTLDDAVSRATFAPLVTREIVLHLLRGPAGPILRAAAARDDGRIRRAVAFMNEHVARRFTIEQVARHVGMSPSHFAHRFRDIVRTSPIQYAKRLRLAQARLLMLGEGLGAAEAAASVGYASPSHFTRDFKHEFGAPPAAYAAQLRAR